MLNIKIKGMLTDIKQLPASKQGREVCECLVNGEKYITLPNSPLGGVLWNYENCKVILRHKLLNGKKCIHSLTTVDTGE